MNDNDLDFEVRKNGQVLTQEELSAYVSDSQVK
jgi:hypothetical protein